MKTSAKVKDICYDNMNRDKTVKSTAQDQRYELTNVLVRKKETPKCVLTGTYF